VFLIRKLGVGMKVLVEFFVSRKLRPILGYQIR